MDSSRFSFSKEERKSSRTSMARNVQSEDVGLEAADSSRFSFSKEERKSQRTSMARNVQSEDVGLEAADSSRFSFLKKERKSQRKIENSLHRESQMSLALPIFFSEYLVKKIVCQNATFSFGATI